MGFWDKVKDAVGDAVNSDASKADKPSVTPADATPTTPAAPPAPTSTGDWINDAVSKAGAAVENATTKAEAAPAAGHAQTKPAEHHAPEHHQAQHHAPEHRSYTVKSGDTLSEIGERFGVPYMEIARLNHIENPDLIYPGQVFKIPGA